MAANRVHPGVGEVKRSDGQIVEEGKLSATRQALRQWAEQRSEPWQAALEATLFSGWIYDTLQPYASQLQMGHPAMMKAIAASKKKNDRLDARRIADLVRCDLLPACYVAPTQIRELRRLLRYRNLVVRQAVRQKNKIAGLLMEVGASYNKRRLHGAKYFNELLEGLEEVPPSVKDLLRLSRGALQMFEVTQRHLLGRLRNDSRLAQRVRLLSSIPGVGEVTALTGALEVGEHERFGSIAHAVSYCGLTSALRSSGERQQRTPLSKQRNVHLQTLLIEAWQQHNRLRRSRKPCSGVKGNLRFPLTYSYHGSHRSSRHDLSKKNPFHNLNNIPTATPKDEGATTRTKKTKKRGRRVAKKDFAVPAPQRPSNARHVFQSRDNPITTAPTPLCLLIRVRQRR